MGSVASSVAAVRSGKVLDGVQAIAADWWTRALPVAAENHAYLAGCRSPVPGMTLGAVADGAGEATDLRLAAPFLDIAYRLDTPLQGGTKRVAEAIGRLVPGLMNWRILCIGSPFTEGCPIAIAPDADDAALAAALDRLLRAFDEEAARRGAAVLAVKDLTGPLLRRLGPLLEAAGFTPVQSLPIAVLDVPHGGIEPWLASLSAATRKDIRRKLKRSRGGVAIERVTRPDAALLTEIATLYESTRTASGVSYDAFELLPEGYFALVVEALGDRALFMLYRVGGALAAFNLLFLEEERVIDKFLGMRYPLARDHDLYAVSFAENVAFAAATGRTLLQTGQTAYAAKLRYGSRLEPCVNYVRARGPALRRLLRWSAPWLALDRWDPDLRRLAERRRSAADGMRHAG